MINRTVRIGSFGLGYFVRHKGLFSIRSLELEARVDGHDAVRVVGVRRALEAHVLHHGLELLLRRELADALHQVLKSLTALLVSGA